MCAQGVAPHALAAMDLLLHVAATTGPDRSSGASAVRSPVTHLERPGIAVLHHDHQIGGACEGQEEGQHDIARVFSPGWS